MNNPAGLVKPGEENLWRIAVQAAEEQYAKKPEAEFSSRDWARTVGLFKKLRDGKRKNPDSRYEIRHVHGEGKDWDRILYFIHDWDDPRERDKESVTFYTSLSGVKNALHLLEADDMKRKNPNEEIEEMEEPDEEDIFFSPAGPLGAHTSVSAGGKHIGTFKSDKDGDADEKAYAAAKKWAKKSNFFPSAWQVSDHGNYHLLSNFWKEENPCKENPRVSLDESAGKHYRIVLWKNNETEYKHTASGRGGIKARITYSVVVYDAKTGDPQEPASTFGIETLAAAKKEFKRLAGRPVKIENPSTEEEPERKLLLDESRGVHIPKKFAQNFDMKKWHVDKEDEQILLKGVDGEHYWEAWEDVLAHAYIIERGKKWTLEQDGDLFAVHYKE